VSIKFKIIY